MGIELGSCVLFERGGWIDVYLHIGTEKTGTTSIQAFLDRNRSRLRSQGVLYPELPGSNNQIALSAAALASPESAAWSKRRSARMRADNPVPVPAPFANSAVPLEIDVDSIFRPLRHIDSADSRDHGVMISVDGIVPRPNPYRMPAADLTRAADQTR
jgi:hypothetical protein